MKEFFKYLTPGSEDINWGLYLNVAGKISIHPGDTYPPLGHPDFYYFTWEKGRVLNEYQICYITEGNGTYENNLGRYKIKPGSLMITKPSDWHRYKPMRNTGWNSNFIGFTGSIPPMLFNHPRFIEIKAVLDVGYREDIIDIYYNIFEYVLEEKPGFQQIVSGEIMKLLGLIISIDRQKNFADKHIEKIIQNARFMIRESVESHFDFKSFSEENNIGYSYFRKMFKKYTGIPPVQYHLSLKIIRAKEMLLHTDKSIKEISNDLGFQSIYYFSRIFKKKLGATPSQIRNTVRH